jgi:iron complex outermembrane receptor protein
VSRSNPTEATGVLDAWLNYNGRINRNGELDATAGYSYEKVTGEYPSFYARGLATDLLGLHGVPNASENVPTVFDKENLLASFFARVNYTHLDRYILTLSMRRDGSSRFGPENQWGTFPAAALGWRVSEEPWFPTPNWMSELKLRASWGVNGNQAFSDYLWLPSYTYGGPFAQVQFGNSYVTTIRPSSVDRGIKWEETTSYNLGFDYGFLDNRINGSLEYYVKNTEDLIFNVTIPAGTNLSNNVTTNIGSLRNTGLELTVNGEVLRSQNRGLSWTASFNASTNKNRLLEINPFSAGTERFLVGGISGGVGSTIQVLQPGAPVNSFYVLQHKRGANGMPLYEDADHNNVINDLDLYVDVNGDGQITQDDRTIFHSSQPQWILAHTSNFGFRNFDLGFTMRAQLGNYVYNNVSSGQGFYNGLNNAGGLVNLHHSVLETNFAEPQFFSDYYVEDASFLRMDNITLGYTLPKIHAVQNARIYGTVQNVFLVTGYSGVDPEAGLNGIDNNIYPRSRTFTAGVSIGF